MMNQSDYFEKSLSFQQNTEFTNLDHGQTGTLENKV